MSVPSSVINICSGVRLNNSYQHTIWFGSLQSQLEYFYGKRVKTYSRYTYLRKERSINVTATVEEAEKWSYLYFSNGGKTYYYFITNVEYLGNESVTLTIELDVMQTYLFEAKLQECFIDREHCAYEAIGSNLVEEGLELGEYVNANSSEVDLNDWRIMILASSDPEIAANPDAVELVSNLGAKYDNVFSALKVYSASINDSQSVNTILNNLSDGKSDIIINIWMYPGELVTNGDTGSGVLREVKGGKTITVEWNRPTSIQGYTPSNLKLFTFPYCTLYVTNNSGDGNAYPFEYFGDPANPVFKVVGTVSPEAAARIYPVNYKGAQNNYEAGLNMSAYPTCAWESDTYKMWLAQTQNQRAVSTGASVASIAGGVALGIAGIATANPALMMSGGGMAAGGITGVVSQMAQKRDKSIMPDEARGTFSTGVAMVAGFQTFTLRNRTITRAQAERLDEFFNLYGYKTNRVKKPNRNCRTYWTYTKTTGCSVYGELCAQDKRKIECIYDNGITFWQNGDIIGNYSEYRTLNKCRGTEVEIGAEA